MPTLQEIIDRTGAAARLALRGGNKKIYSQDGKEQLFNVETLLNDVNWLQQYADEVNIALDLIKALGDTKDAIVMDQRAELVMLQTKVAKQSEISREMLEENKRLDSANKGLLDRLNEQERKLDLTLKTLATACKALSIVAPVATKRYKAGFDMMLADLDNAR